MLRVVRFAWLSIVLLMLLLSGFAWGQSVDIASSESSAFPQPMSLSGWFHILWEDPLPDSDAEPTVRYILIDDQDQWTELLLDEELVKPFGGPLVLNRKRVKIVGEGMTELPLASHVRSDSNPPVRVRSIELEQSEDTQAAALEAALPAVIGSKPWVTILCRFADFSSVTPHPKNWYETLMGSSYPGMDHYWREVSYENINLTGSVVVGWYNLPQPRSYYVYDMNGDGKEDFDTRRATDDCTATADANVFFPSFVGINLLFNYRLAGGAYGGSLTVTRDGQTKNYSLTWITLADEAPAGQGGSYPDQGVLAHEMGHGFGLLHSSGSYGQTYDSDWDVMSKSRNCASLGLPPHPQYGCPGVHTISYHKDLLGWIPPARKYMATPGSSQSITIERIGQPVAVNNYLMAQIPIGGSTTQFYTVEARRFVGYDDKIPGEAIIIHRVDTTNIDPNNPLGNARAQVVDVDNNGDPNDAGAMWTPSETFTDPGNGTTVSVNAATQTGFVVTITYQPPNIKAAFESPEDGPVSGVAVIRGWAFATQAGVSISKVELFIDGVSAGDIPCCSDRADVQAAFPQFPAQNTLNSGWGTTFNWGVLSPGTHSVQVVIRNTVGEQLATETRTVTVVKPGNFEFLDQFSLSGATARIEGDQLVVEGAVVRDKASQQKKQINARYRWFTSSQSLQTVEAVTIGTVFSLRSFVTELFASLSVRLLRLSAVTDAQASPGLVRAFESPEVNQVVSGVAVIRGWAFTDVAGASLTEVRLVIDGMPSSSIPCCSARGDVAAAFPTNSNALNSGWGFTINYGNLPVGFHNIGIRLSDSVGASVTDTHGVTVIKVGGFEFLDQFNLSGATARIEGEDIVVSGVRVRDKASQQSKTIEVRLRWFQSSQALGTVASAG